MSNYHLRDRELSLRSIGLLSKILSLPEDWDYSVRGLTSICKEGKDAVAAALKELEDAGYIERRMVHGAGSGKFSGVEYFIFERPPVGRDPPVPELWTGSPTEADSPCPGKPDTVKPDAESPCPGKPDTANPPQLSTKGLNTNQVSTNVLSTEYNNPPIVPPQGDGAGGPKTTRRRREPKEKPDWKPDRFDAFWKSYPRGESKQAAIAAWDKLRPSDDLLVVMAKGLKRQMSTEAWQRGIGIPYASTWLNQRRWTDEVKAPQEPPDPPEDNDGYLLEPGVQAWD